MSLPERRALVCAQLVTGKLVVAHALPGRVLARESSQELVQSVGRPDVHRCTHTVAQPVIHSGTGS